MLTKAKKNSGLTLTELLVSMAILIIVLGLGYNFYTFTVKSYQSTENKWIKQREVRKASNFISSEVRNAYSLEIKNTIPASGTEGEYDIYLQNGVIKFMDGTKTPVVIAQGDLNLVFDKAQNKDNIKTNKALAYEVKANDINYAINSSVILSNLPDNGGLVSTLSGSSIHFKSASDSVTIPAADLGDFCFIATAAYGSKYQPSVMLLRQFRDEVLLQTKTGTEFVEFYYKNSPQIAHIIAGNNVLRSLTLILLIPVVGIVVVFMYKEVMFLLMIFIILKIYLSRKRELLIKI